MALRLRNADTTARWLWRHATALQPSDTRLIHSTSAGLTHAQAVPATAPISPPLPLPPLHTSRLSTLFTSRHAAQLRSHGFVIIDGAFGDSFCSRLLGEALLLRQRGLLALNHTHLVHPADRRTALLPKRGILEADTHTPGLAAIIPAFHQLTCDLSLLQSIAAQLPSLSLHSQTVKVQLNEGSGSCFPLHFDSDSALDRRHVSCLLYLNRDYDAARDGGQLQLCPIPYDSVTIEPRWDRLVLFATSAVLHRVLPAAQPRVCTTLWMSGGPLPAQPFPPPDPSPDPSSSSSSAAVESLRCLLHPRLYAHYCKLLLSSQWADSILQSHPDTADTRRAVAQHAADVAVISKALTRWLQHVPDGLLPVGLAGTEMADSLPAGVKLGAGLTEGATAAVLAIRAAVNWDTLRRFL